MKNHIDAEWIEKTIKDFIDTSPENRLKQGQHEKAFDTPLVGFSSGDDPIYQDFKEHVGPFYMTPWEAFALAFSDLTIKPEKLMVVGWILPQTEKTKSDNRKEDFYPSERWARARIFGEEANVKLKKHLVSSLAEKGVKATAPTLMPQFSVRVSPAYGWSSTWSERHAAFASGLGTFGLCDGLITSAGKAMRAGSVVVELNGLPTSRPYQDPYEYCLFYTHGICGKCIARCPARAISKEGKDKTRCRRHLFPITGDFVKEQYGFKGYGCGLCQTGVPCESKIPLPQDIRPC